ncbi:hypothetical protein ACFOWE_09640 [Planomonospora corallina]|uniref:Lipopolysaccharide assembly protein A domain-containing protein n=1 Tax=Planomonospora corallina TaxID=1806052 RepID=A0ABV8I5W3_9ACTN
MIVLGLLLIVLAGAVMVAAFWNETALSSAAASFTVFDRTFQFSPLEFFLAGAATGALFLLGLALLLSGVRHAAARRRRLRDSRLAARDRVAQLEEEKRELERRLEQAPAAPPAGRAADRDLSPAAADRDRDGVADRDEPTVPHQRAEVPRQPESTDQLVAGRHQRTTHRP